MGYGAKLRLKYWLANTFLVWLAILVYRENRYYSDFLRADAQTALLWIAVAYTILGFAFYAFIPDSRVSESKGFIVLRTIVRLFKGIFSFAPWSGFSGISRAEKIAIMFTAVKFFFLPIMLNFALQNYNAFNVNYQLWQSNGFGLGSFVFNTAFYPLALSLIFLVDTVYFAFGYAVEAGFLKNVVRSVEPTFLGWAVTLACYPPFNGYVVNYIGSYQNDFAAFESTTATIALRVAVIFFLGIYLWATLALGAKCSNLTNRGIVSRGPYAIVRHPAYISKTMVWWITLIPFILAAAEPRLIIPAILSAAAWGLIYYLRSITEERHLLRDPDYVEYCKKVKYKFIPGVY
ncbi:hypothetical protein JXB11_05190 [Candidatus Woesearchaeota archaeon]|nr:hypothetical protein [Candidatus Woesearchaeota archaeon]